MHAPGGLNPARPRRLGRRRQLHFPRRAQPAMWTAHPRAHCLPVLRHPASRRGAPHDDRSHLLIDLVAKLRMPRLAINRVFCRSLFQGYPWHSPARQSPPARPSAQRGLLCQHSNSVDRHRAQRWGSDGHRARLRWQRPPAAWAARPGPSGLLRRRRRFCSRATPARKVAWSAATDASTRSTPPHEITTTESTARQRCRRACRAHHRPSSCQT